MKKFAAILLTVSMIVTLMTGSLVSANAYSDDSAAVGTGDGSYAPVNSIFLHDAGKGETLLEGGSAEMERVSETLFRYTFKDLKPDSRYGCRYGFHFYINNDINDRFGRGSDLTDYGFDVPIRVIHYPYGESPSAIEINLTENNITITAGRVFV